MHYSRKYHNSPMPYSIFFRGGYAIHGTGAVSQLGRPASHGCIRLAPANAATLYSLVQQQGGAIQISGTPPFSTMLADAPAKRRQAAKAPRLSPEVAQAPAPRRHVAAARAPRDRIVYVYSDNPAPLAYAPAPLRQHVHVRTWQASPWGWLLR